MTDHALDYAEDLFGDPVEAPTIQDMVDVPHHDFWADGILRHGFELGVGHEGGWRYVQDDQDGRVWIVTGTDDVWAARVDPDTVTARTIRVDTILRGTGLRVSADRRLVHVTGCIMATRNTAAPIHIQRSAIDAIMRGDNKMGFLGYRLCDRCFPE